MPLCLQTPFETPYVVRLHNVNLLDVPKPLFTFVHPNKGNRRLVLLNSNSNTMQYKRQCNTIDSIQCNQFLFNKLLIECWPLFEMRCLLPKCCDLMELFCVLQRAVLITLGLKLWTLMWKRMWFFMALLGILTASSIATSLSVSGNHFLFIGNDSNIETATSYQHHWISNLLLYIRLDRALRGISLFLFCWIRCD